MVGLISEEKLSRILVSGAALLLVLKLYFALKLDLYSDEIFYWLASTRLALAYSDLPFMTSLLVWLGSALGSGSTLAVRSLFILLGSSIPILIYWLSIPITDKTQALQSALLALCIPLGGFLGLLAVPDVPLLFFGILSIGFFERAIRTEKLAYWLATGIVVALGLCTHYRFFLYPAAAVLFLLAVPAERKQWRNPYLWMAVCIASLGLLPIAWFNLTNQLSSASFYLVERHPWTFQPSGLLHAFKQAGLVTPPLYALLAVTLWTILQRARQGDRPAAMLACFSLANLLVYLLLAPWTDSSSTSIHWPLSGYFPLLVFAPVTLQSVYEWARNHGSDSLSRSLALAIPSIGFLGSIVAIAVIGTQAFQQPMQSIVGSGILSNKMAGWREFATHTSQLLADEFGGQSPVIVTDNYYTAAQVIFANLTEQAFTVDTDKAVRDGRRLQVELWNMDESALSDEANRPMLFITEDSTLTIPDKQVVIGTVCGYVDNLSHLGRLSLFNGDKSFSFYLAGRVIATGEPSAFETNSCPYPARSWIDEPAAGDQLTGIARVQGWAYNEDIGLQSIHLFLNGEDVARLEYGIPRPDVVDVMAVQSDPNSPNLGYAGRFDTRTVTSGDYTLAIRLTDNRGVTSIYGERSISIAN